MTKTNDLISHLGNDLRTKGKERPFEPFLAWIVGTAACLIILFFIIRIRPDFTEHYTSSLFQIETALYFLAFMAGAVISYRSSIPLLLQKRDLYIGGALFTAAVALLLSKMPLSGWESELQGELNFYRGRCGPMILGIALVESTLLMLLARRAAPIRPVLTGTWIALTAGTMGLFLMQFVCEHENFLHLILWHAAPVLGLSWVGAVSAKRLLKW